MLQVVILQLPPGRGRLVVTHEVLLHVDVEALSLARQPDSLPQRLSGANPSDPPVAALAQLATLQVLQSTKLLLSPVLSASQECHNLRKLSWCFGFLL